MEYSLYYIIGAMIFAFIVLRLWVGERLRCKCGNVFKVDVMARINECPLCERKYVFQIMSPSGDSYWEDISNKVPIKMLTMPPKPMVKRSSAWPKVRAAHLKIQPTCQVCGGTDELNVHHIHPVHLHPDRELDETNLITLCEGSHHLNCHLLFGHFQSWYSYNENVVEDCKLWLEKITKRP